jgi:hypothetical protein
VTITDPIPMKKICTAIATCCFILNASAQFSGSYAPESWTTVLPANSNGHVNISNAPTSITINGSNDAANVATMQPVTTDYAIVASSTGPWSFTWSYRSNDQSNNPQQDIAGVLINGVFIQLTNNSGSADQSGTFNGMDVTAGTVIGFRVSATNNIDGNATFTVANFSPPGSTLALTLNNFRAKLFGEKVLLNWSTRDERSMAGFTVERSANGTDFQYLCSAAARNQQGNHTYESTDEKPFVGTSYYRLRMKELNGTEKTSPVVAVKMNGISSLQLSPNPAKDFVRISFQSGKTGRERIDVLDAAGRVLQSNFYDVKMGQQSITLNQLPLTRGLFYVRTSEKVASFIKQ